LRLALARAERARGSGVASGKRTSIAGFELGGVHSELQPNFDDQSQYTSVARHSKITERTTMVPT
jgi:hypothetical protein